MAAAIVRKAEQPRSQGLSSLPPLVVGGRQRRETLGTRLEAEHLLCETIGHVRYINIQASLRGFRVKIANF